MTHSPSPHSFNYDDSDGNRHFCSFIGQLMLNTLNILTLHSCPMRQKLLLYWRKQRQTTWLASSHTAGKRTASSVWLWKLWFYHLSTYQTTKPEVPRLSQLMAPLASQQPPAQFWEPWSKLLLHKNIIFGLTLLVSPGSLLEIRNLWLHSRPTENQTAFNKVFR